MCIYIYIYIYIERERERKKERKRDRERERERERERRREGEGGGEGEGEGERARARERMNEKDPCRRCGHCATRMRSQGDSDGFATQRMGRIIGRVAPKRVFGFSDVTVKHRILVRGARKCSPEGAATAATAAPE